METETKNCTTCQKEFTVFKEDKVLYHETHSIPPNECINCRFRHKLAFWTFGKFRKATSALSGKSIITVFPESVPFPIYDREEWISDTWNPLDYGQDYDPNRPFFDQIAELQRKVPHPHQSGLGNTNCQWSDDIWNSKNCYLTRSGLENEELMYTYRDLRCKNSVDLTYCFDSELCHDLLYCFKCYKVRSSIDTRNAVDSMFLYDCRNVQNCFMSWNLRNKQYCILNKQYTKEEYLKKLAEFDTASRKGVADLREKFLKLIETEAIHRENSNSNTTNSTGNFITEDKDCFSCAFFEKSENCRYAFRGINSKDSIDAVGSISEKSSALLLSMWVYEGLGLLYCSNCRYSSYLDACDECEYCFGCVGLKKKKYCILNKQYTKEEYEVLVEKIKSDMKKRGEWGKFFPLSMTYSGYNLSLAQLHFPLTKEKAISLGGRWDEKNDATHDGISSNETPDRIEEVEDSITTQPLLCPETGYRFNIAPQELEFYRTHSIPLPNRHPDARVLNRFKRIARAVESNPGSCFFCKKDITHYYPAELGYQKIACTECYQKEIA